MKNSVNQSFPSSFHDIQQLTLFFKMFSDSTRLQIIICLMQHELYVNEICSRLNLSQSAVSHQLSILKSNRLVKFQRIGKNILYSLNDEHIHLILSTAMYHLSEKEEVK